MNYRFSLKRTFVYLVGSSSMIWKKRAKLEIQLLYVISGTRRVSGLWYYKPIIPTQRAISAFAAKMHREYDVVQLCVKAPIPGNGEDSHEVYQWRNGELTTNWHVLGEK